MSKRIIGGYAYNAALTKIRNAVSVALLAIDRLSGEPMGPQTRAAQFVKVAMALNEITSAVMELDNFSKEYQTGELRFEGLNPDEEKRGDKE